ncbi:MAG: hypothetical protein WBD20_10940 [Pirellulaceae bacterium]
MPSRVSIFALGFAFIATCHFLTATTDADDKHEPKSDVGHTAIVEDSMHEFMEYVFQPTYKRLKVSMASQPADNAGWKAIKSDSLILAESCNLLFARAPEENVDDWNKHSVDSREAGAKLYKAAGAKQFDAASSAYRSMLESCNACHRKFEKGRHILTP